MNNISCIWKKNKLAKVW